eukprot:1086287-Pelagomonas_calceolata.AAC.2
MLCFLACAFLHVKYALTVTRVVLTSLPCEQVVGAGKAEGAMDAANLLKPMLARGELHCIGACDIWKGTCDGVIARISGTVLLMECLSRYSFPVPMECK